MFFAEFARLLLGVDLGPATRTTAGACGP
jgi:hypothetical protein